MAQIKIPVADFHLLCKITCETVEVYKYPDETSDEADFFDTYFRVSNAPEPASKTVSFPLPLADLQGATITSAKVYATVGSPLYGAESSVINGVGVGVGKTVAVDVAIPDGAASIEVPFRFLCKTPAHTHDTSSEEWADEVTSRGLYEYHHWYFDHESRLDYTGVYLLIEYEGGAGYIYRAEGGKLAPYQLCRAEGGKLVPYQLHRAEGGKLVPY